MIGFKSFASRTKIDFRPGIMAVVGPNGCGKTNIVDAIRWVLGEQRTGTLRAERMESVIFNGTQSRRPLGMSEVTLLIDNNKGILPTSYSQVAVTRRLYRSGESEYLINRNVSRLRDIYDLFTDTGLGHSTYSIIELSMVEGIISGPSESRRYLIEEAAGVAKYKSRRNSTEKRLANTRESLQRLDDVFFETERRYKTLKRQASRAQRYQDLAAALQLRLLVDLAEERMDILTRREPFDERLKELDDIIEESENVQEDVSRQQIAFEGREINLIDRLNRAQDSSKRVERRISEAQSELALTQQRITFLDNGKSDSLARLDELQKAIKNSEASLDSTLKSSEGLKETLSGVKSALAGIDEKFEKGKAFFEASRHKLSSARKEEEKLRNQYAALQADDKRREMEKKRFRERTRNLNSERDRLAASISQLQAKISEGNSAITQKTEALKQVQSSRKDVDADLENARLDHSEKISNHARLSASAEAAKESLKSHLSRTTSLFSLPEKIRNEVDRRLLVPLSERIECLEEYNLAIAASLREVLDALDIPDLQTCLAYAEDFKSPENAVFRISEAKDSRGKDKPGNQDRIIAGEAGELPPEAANCRIASTLVNNAGEFGEFIRKRLANYVVVPDRDVIIKLAPWASVNSVILVTLDGECYHPDGIFYAGKLDSTALQIGWEKKLDELKGNLEQVSTAVSVSKKDLEAVSANLKITEQKVIAERRKILSLEDEIAHLNRHSASLKAETDRKVRRLKELEREIHSIEQQALKLDLPEDVTRRILDIQTAIKKSEQVRQATESEFQLAENQRVQIADERTALASEMTRLTERLRFAENTAESDQKSVDQARIDLASCESRIAESDRELQRVKQAAENIKSQLALFERDKNDLATAIELLNKERTDLKNETAESRKKMSSYQQHLKEALKERNQVESEVIGLRERLREVDRRLLEEAKTRPESVGAETANNAVADLEPLGYADLSAEKIRTRLSSLGPVNMLALEELVEVEERYHFLEDQKQDLENGIEVLEETIDRINSEARRRLRETFDKVNMHFQRIFQALFEGGESRIQLEGDDPLNADIKIFATPTGKRMQALSMLSGGEKALTAIALLFGIYQVRPSPFCILDEIDAPLDDVNISRFTRLMTEFAKNTQFLIVTHNKRSMEAADCLIGVTLGEDGSSNLVSVKLERETQAQP